MPTPLNTPSMDALSHYIDRFLFAEGWRVTAVVAGDNGIGYDVTLTQQDGTERGRSVTRSAPSAGEATFLACSSARQTDARPEEA